MKRDQANAPPPAPSPASQVRANSDFSAVFERQIEEMIAALDRGEHPRAEQFLAQLPGLADEEAIRIVFEEACLRMERGETSVTAEFLQRFPQWSSALGLLVECKRLLLTAARADFPEPGDDLGDFRLLSEIGRGAVGRTFLASQHSLANRLMVLKVTPLGAEEHLRLARLQHMNIVPLYVEHVFPDRNVRVLGMPYLGGTSLDRVLESLAAVPHAQRTGKHLLDALDRSAPPVVPESVSLSLATGPFRKYLAQATFVEAICWIGACLADALQYAHDRGLVHLDVKPSNVLIAADGQPMLLDFHLAREPLACGQPAPDRLGGTSQFQSPEQHAAIESVRWGSPIRFAVDGRSDLYSLGQLLYEALGGEAATHTTSRRPLSTCNPRVSPGLSDIVRKCLAPEADARYADAASLALDLRRHLNDFPLRGVSNRSLVERWRKWRRRRPSALLRLGVWLGVTSSLLMVAAVLALQFYQREHQIGAALAEGRDYVGKHHYPEAIAAFRRGLALADNWPGARAQQRALHASLQRVQRLRNAAELHEMVDLLRFRFGMTPPEPAEARSLYLRGRELWQSRDRILSPAGEPIDAGTEQNVRADLIDLARILAGMAAQQAPGDGAGVAEPTADAVLLLREALAQFGPSAAMSRDLWSLTRSLGQTRADTPPPVSAPPGTAWEHHDLGRSYLRSGDHALAETEFRRAIELRPEEFWPYFYHGLCCYKLERHADAVASFGTAIALAPRTAECYFNRALAYQALGRDDDAIRDDTRALALNPRFTDAALNRGIALLRTGRHAAALEDFERARATASGPRMLALIAYNTALVAIARNDLPAARANLELAIKHGDKDARDLYDRLRFP
ncbi:MAG: serine/threonine-protein kinase [Isosphaeraceae bacterium]|nr:serine/threonine-protein kinase [Isosphaeraceae bacterium]